MAKAKRLEGWKGRLSPARLVVLLIALALVAVLGYRQLGRLIESRVTVFTAAADLAAGDTVDAIAIDTVRLPKAGLPPDVLLDRSAIEGRVLTRPKMTGMRFRERDFSSPAAQPGLAEILPAGRVMLTVTPSNFRPLTEMASLFRLGDRFDILALTPGESTVVARDVYFAAWMEPRPPEPADSGDDDGGTSSFFADALQDLTPEPQARQAPGATPLLVGLHPEDVVPLSLAQSRGAYLVFVLHGRKEVEEGELLRIGRLQTPPARVPLETAVELISGARREVLRVRR
jgi:hypothetical protein